MGLSKNTPTVSKPPKTFKYPRKTMKLDAFSDPVKSIFTEPCPIFFIYKFDGFVGGAVSPNLACNSSHSSGRPSS